MEGGGGDIPGSCRDRAFVSGWERLDSWGEVGVAHCVWGEGLVGARWVCLEILFPPFWEWAGSGYSSRRKIGHDTQGRWWGSQGQPSLAQLQASTLGPKQAADHGRGVGHKKRWETVIYSSLFEPFIMQDVSMLLESLVPRKHCKIDPNPTYLQRKNHSLRFSSN